MLKEVVYADGTDFIFKTKENSRPELFCKKMLRPATLLKSRLWHRCFSVNFVKILRTRFFIEHLRRLLLEEKNNMMETVNTVIPSRNLKINDDKTEHTFLQR